MRTYHFSFQLIITLIFSALLIVFTSSCDKEESYNEPFSLSGNISDYVPESSVSLKCHALLDEDGSMFFRAVINENADFNLWGLKIKNVDFYLDDVLVGNTSGTTNSINKILSGQVAGDHTAHALVTIGGDNTSDLKIKCTQKFYTPKSTNGFDVFFKTNYITQGDYLTITPVIIKNPNNYELLSGSLSWDNVEVGKSTEAPFEVKYLVKDAVGTKHNLYYKLSYRYKTGNATITTSWSYTHPSYEINDAKSVIYAADVMSSSKIFNNGDEFKIYANPYIGKEVSVKPNLQIYIDSKLIGSSSTFPAIISSRIDGLSRGVHEVNKRWVDENGKLLIGTYDYIAVR